MEITTIVFPLKIIENNNITPLVKELEEKFHTQIQTSSDLKSISIHGTPQNVVSTKAVVLKNTLKFSTTSIQNTLKEILLNQNGEIKVHVKKRIDYIMSSTNTQITVASPTNSIKPPPGIAFNCADETLDVEIIGSLDDIHNAKIQCLSLIDEMMGLQVESVTVDIRMIPMISGKKRSKINEIMQETCTNIYLPCLFKDPLAPLPNLGDAEWDQDPAFSSKILISGLSEQVSQAKQMLLDVISRVKPAVSSKHVVCVSRKLDWILMNKRRDLVKVMEDNGCFVILPPLGSSTNMLTIIGVDSVYIERSTRAVMLLVCCFYVACISKATSTKPSKSLMENIAKTSDAEIIIQPQFIEIVGLEKSVKYAIQQLLTIDYFKNVKDCKFQLELALEHKEFINGKKNGKINKIIKTSGCKINFTENFNGYNMLIELANISIVKALEGLGLLQDEMPAEISFFVPETYHKRIIGVGGKNIQRIMKKYGVYVKFSNAEEFANLGGYFDNQDNVIARTPFKNRESLDLLKESIMELIVTKDTKEVESAMRVDRQFHRLIFGSPINRIEESVCVEIKFPKKESGSSDLVIKGTEAEIQQAKKLVQDLIPEIRVLNIPNSPMAKTVLESPEFQEKVVSDLNKQDAELLLFKNDVNSITLILLYKPDAKVDDLITNYLISQQVPLQMDYSFANMSVPRTTSYDSFQHFNSKLLAPITEPPLTTSSYSLFEGASLGGFELQNRKQIQSAPNLRLLFEEALLPNSFKSRSEVFEDSDGVDSLDLLGTTLAATSVRSRNLLNMDGYGNVSPPGNDTRNFWNNISLGVSPGLDEKIPTDKFRGLSLSRSVPDTSKIGLHHKNPSPSKLSQHFDADSIDGPSEIPVPESRVPPTKPWPNVSHFNPNAPSFTPGQN